MIDECLLEMVRTEPPVLFQVLPEIASNNHSTAVAHIASCLQLSHQRIDEGHTSGSVFPALYCLTLCSPVKVLPIVDTILVQKVSSVIHAPEGVVFSHQDLVHVRTEFLVFRWVNRPVDLSERQATVC